MPSTKDPSSSVNAGPGLLPAGVVPASSLLFVPGGGANAALNAHINNPHDAHLAHAIGIDPYYPYGSSPPTGTPLIQAVGGPIDGESVLDFINEFKDLLPPRPNTIGFATSSVGNPGVPNWDALMPVGTGDAASGGYDNSGNVQLTQYIVGSAITSFEPSGFVYPADRGVLALYKNTSGNFLDSAHTTLVAALSLNDTAPAGVPNAAFNEQTRNTSQLSYTATGSGIDQFSLNYRVPCAMGYFFALPPNTPSPIQTYPFFFPRYQVAIWSLNSLTIGTGNSQSWVLVHWRETFATTLASIQPASLTLGNLIPGNCYSAVPTSNTTYATGSWDDPNAPAYTVNRHFVFQDAGSATSPAPTVFTATLTGSPSSQDFSGVPYYNNPSALQWTADIQATGMCSNSFRTASANNPPNVPVGQHSYYDPIQIDFTLFGGGIVDVPYFYLNKLGGSQYSITNSPAPGDTVEFKANGSSSFGYLNIPTPYVGACPPGGSTVLTAYLRNAFHEQTAGGTTNYLINTYPTQSDPTTTTFEPFATETYRYLTSFDPTTSATVPIIPTGGNIFPSSTPFVVTGPDAQVAGQLQYPSTNYSTGFAPSGGPNYSGFPAGDGANHLRRFQRAFDTGIARNTGWIRLSGLASAYVALAPYDGNEITGHTNSGDGVIVQIKVPGAGGTGWLDLGRTYGQPSMGTSDFYGCEVTTITSGEDVYIYYNTTAYTSNNGSGNFLLFVRVSFINGVGNSKTLSQMQWYPPTFTPP